MEIGVIRRGDAAYPERLAEIKSPPKQLFYIGDIELLKKKCVAVVGSRTSTAYGRNTAKAIAGRLAGCGITVISGMAVGIDRCAHEGALAVNGGTVAVLGCGPDVCYPPDNVLLKKEIERKGLIISEYRPGTLAKRYNFPQRNRIISGLCEAVVIVQARNRSGALITAELAAEQGRDVMAVPGNIDSQYNLGNNKLIKEGATPVISVDDVLEPLGMRRIDAEQARIRLSDTEYMIFELLVQHGEMSIDEICYNTGKKPEYINPILSVMEIKGIVFSALGKVFLANA